MFKLNKKNKNFNKNKTKVIKIADLKKLRKIRDNVAGIDIGSEEHFVASPDPKHDGKIVVKSFGTFTENLKECVDWLKECKIESVAMEATGVYWTILYSMLEKEGIEVLLVNPRDFTKMKDKKTDVCDSEYLQLFHSYGLLEGAFIPENEIIQLRTIIRLRDQHVKESAAAIQRMQKALIMMNLRLDYAINDISGATGMSIIEAILSGERDAKKLASHRDLRCHRTEEEIESALNGFYQDDQLFALKQSFQQYKFFIAQITACDEQIQKNFKKFESVAEKTIDINDHEKETKKKENKFEI